MVVLFVGCGCVAETRKNVLFLRRKTTRRDTYLLERYDFVPARTKIVVKLLKRGEISAWVG